MIAIEPCKAGFEGCAEMRAEDIRKHPRTARLAECRHYPIPPERPEPDDDHRAAVEDGLILVRWANGIVELESPADLTLTAALSLVIER